MKWSICSINSLDSCFNGLLENLQSIFGNIEDKELNICLQLSLDTGN